MKTNAAVLFQLGKPLEIIQLEIPPLGKGQVLVKMAYTGICRSQINEIMGLKGADPYLPHTLGHEGSGVVVECGPGVTKVKPDDCVIATWIKGSGLDASQIVYTDTQGQKVNSGPISTFMEYAIVGENRLIPISSKISMRDASLFGCAIPTGAGIVFNDLKVTPKSTVAIFGVGGIGASALIAASCQSPNILIAIDTEDSKLALAKDLGATHTINSNSENVTKAILEITNNRGVDFSIEAVGLKGVMEMAFKSVRDKGGLCAIAGNVAKGVSVEFDPFDFIKGKRLIGSWGGGVDPDHDIPHFLDRFSMNTSKLDLLVSHVLRLDEINNGIDLMQQKKAARVLIRF